MLYAWMLGISDYSSKQTSSAAKETASMAKEHDKTNVVLTRFFFSVYLVLYLIYLAFSIIMNYWANLLEKLLEIQSLWGYLKNTYSQKIHRTLKKTDVTGYFFEPMCSLTDHFYRKKCSACSFMKKILCQQRFPANC